MAFAVTGYRAYPVDIAIDKNIKAIQHLELAITGTSADVLLDLSNPAGTFWTAAGSSAVGAAALSALNAIVLIALGRKAFYLQGVTDGKVQTYTADTVASNGFKLTSATVIPDVTQFAGEGLTSYFCSIEIAVLSGSSPITSALGL